MRCVYVVCLILLLTSNGFKVHGVPSQLDHCVVEGLFVPKGETWQPAGKCQQATCMGGNVTTYLKCNSTILPLHWINQPEDPTKPFPDCCAKPFPLTTLESWKPGNFGNFVESVSSSSWTFQLGKPEKPSKPIIPLPLAFPISIPNKPETPENPLKPLIPGLLPFGLFVRPERPLKPSIPSWTYFSGLLDTPVKPSKLEVPEFYLPECNFLRWCLGYQNKNFYNRRNSLFQDCGFSPEWCLGF